MSVKKVPTIAKTGTLAKMPTATLAPMKTPPKGKLATPKSAAPAVAKPKKTVRGM